MAKSFEERLSELIDDYLNNKGCGPCGSFRIIAFYSSISIELAIIYACDRGKIKVGNSWIEDPHYAKLNVHALKRAKLKLMNIKEKLKVCSDFLEVYRLVRAVTDIKWLDRMFWYDTSFRIAASFDNEEMLPKHVFYQRGAQLGALKFGIISKPDEENPYIEYSKFLRVSRQFEKLKPYEIEDFLCHYYKELDFAK